MARVVALDLGSRSLKVVEMEGSARRPVVRRFFEREIPADAEEDVVVNAINSLFSGEKLATDNVLVAIPAQKCLFREIEIDFTSEEQIRKLVKFEVEPHLPGMPIEDVVVDYHVIEKGPKTTKLLVVACPKKVISSTLRILDRCGIDPYKIDVDIYALCNSLSQLVAPGGAQAVLLIDFGAQATKIAIVEGGRPVHIRTPRIGFEVLGHLSERDLESDMSDSQVLDRTREEAGTGTLDLASLEKDLVISLSSLDEGVSDEVPVDSAVPEDVASEARERKKTETFDRLGKELMRMLAARQAGDLECAYVVGGGSTLAGFNEHISAQLGIPVMPLDVLGKVDHRLNGEDPGDLNPALAVAVGLGIKGAGRDPLSLDLRKEEFVFTRTFERVKGHLAFFVCALFVFLLVLCYYVQERTDAARKEYEAYLRRAVTAYRVHEDPVPWLEKSAPGREESWISMMRQKLAQLTALMDDTKQRKSRSALAVWGRLFEAIDQARSKVRLERGRPFELRMRLYEFNQEVLAITGRVVSRKPLVDLETMVQSIRAVAGLEEATWHNEGQGEVEKDPFSRKYVKFRLSVSMPKQEN